jgi:hypothetical protein
MYDGIRRKELLTSAKMLSEKSPSTNPPTPLYQRHNEKISH